MPFAEANLVLYKNHPARVKHVGEKLEIELSGGETARVRPKDVVLLHPGPLRHLGELQPQTGEVQTAWELVAGSQTTLPELAELIYGSYTPATAWATWQLVSDGLYFRGNPEEVTACTPEEVARKQAARQAEAAEKRAWQDFLERATARRLASGDERYLHDVEELALKQNAQSRTLRELGLAESPENAHAFLLESGYWTPMVNPYPQRFGLDTSAPALEPPALPDEARLDLTHLQAWAIDDEGADTPDDALSLVPGPAEGWAGARLWVHVADAAALVQPGSPIDLEARARGATLYLPEKRAPMLPAGVVKQLGLGLAEVSPALSFGLDLDADGRVAGIDIRPSWVRVSRLTYEEAETCLAQEPFKSLYHLSQVYQARRQASGAILIESPEVKVRVDVEKEQITLRLLQPLKSRAMVQEAMVMTGEAVARFAIEHKLPLPFAAQEAPDTNERPATMSGMYALRRALKRTQYKSIPSPHAGSGLAAYAQATSPLRRYLDLVVHQQVRTYLRGEKPLDTHEISERISATESIIGSLRQVEQLSNEHWTLVYLSQHPKWRGEGIIVEKRGSGGQVLIPELGLEAQVHLPTALPLDSPVSLSLHSVNLAYRTAHFRVEL